MLWAAYTVSIDSVAEPLCYVVEGCGVLVLQKSTVLYGVPGWLTPTPQIQVIWPQQPSAGAALLKFSSVVVW